MKKESIFKGSNLEVCRLLSLLHVLLVCSSVTVMAKRFESFSTNHLQKITDQQPYQF